MRIRYSEKPRHWWIVVGGLALLLAGVPAWLWWRQRISPAWLGVAGSISMGLCLGCALYPRAARAVYRVMMTFSGYCGHWIGTAVLGVIFVAVVIPLGVAMRVSGRDLLELRRPSGSELKNVGLSCWKPARSNNRHDRMF